MTIRVAIADDHPTMLAGMEHLMAGFAGMTVIGLVTDSTQLVQLLGSQSCDVVITDFSMPKGRYGDGISLLRFLQRRFPLVRLVVLTGVESETVLRSILAIDVRVIVSKSDDYACLETAIHRARDKQDFLSPDIERILQAASASGALAPEAGGQLSKRETEVMRLFAEGLSVSQISERIGRSRKTVSAQKVTGMKKLGLQRDADIFRYAVAHGLVQASESARSGAKEADE
ncbi:response regulator transcription factor [Dyella subtropica]|uniref:response regulator transcription factor n=1 Tax=Dyella subtropica TaxID=2992127 RepID=UPI0022561D57|nr:response regulator transcription factor [Dyella subtropica]